MNSNLGTVICRYPNSVNNDLVDLIVKSESNGISKIFTTSKYEYVNIGDKIKMNNDKE